jgi:hypothetical protein
MAYDPAKVEDQVRLLTRILKTLEPDGQATGCNPVQVGSIPTGVSFKQRCCRANGARRPVLLKRPLATCVPHMGSNQGGIDLGLAQWVEHQTLNLDVAGSTPVPDRRPKTCSKEGPKAANVSAVGRSQMETGQPLPNHLPRWWKSARSFPEDLAAAAAHSGAM